MQKPLKEMIFRPVEGIWKNIAGESATLADVLTGLNLIIDEKIQFARIYDYDNNLCIYYRAQTMKITITIWTIDTNI